jgi:hypothetical protein
MCKAQAPRWHGASARHLKFLDRLQENVFQNLEPKFDNGRVEGVGGCGERCPGNSKRRLIGNEYYLTSKLYDFDRPLDYPWQRLFCEHEVAKATEKQ